MTVAFALIGLCINTLLFDYYPYLTKFMVVFINLGTLYVLIALLVRTHPKASAHTGVCGSCQPHRLGFGWFGLSPLLPPWVCCYQ